jgi:hypothetical protein
MLAAMLTPRWDCDRTGVVPGAPSANRKPNSIVVGIPFHRSFNVAMCPYLPSSSPFRQIDPTLTIDCYNPESAMFVRETSCDHQRDNRSADALNPCPYALIYLHALGPWRADPIGKAPREARLMAAISQATFPPFLCFEYLDKMIKVVSRE